MHSIQFWATAKTSTVIESSNERDKSAANGMIVVYVILIISYFLHFVNIQEEFPVQWKDSP